MTRLIRYCALAVAGVLALALLVLGALVLFIDPNDYRAQISKLAQEKAGVTLTLAGDLGWTFYPVLGFKAQGVGLALRADAPALMQVDAVSAGVRLLPLLSRRIEIDALDVTGLHAHLVVDANGRNNWELPDSAASRPAGAGAQAADAGASSGASGGGVPALQIPAIRVHDSQIRYEDKQGNADYTVDLSLLQLTDVSLEEAFPLLLKARVRDGAKRDVALELNTQVRADLAGKKFAVHELTLDATATGVFSRPVTIYLSGEGMFDQLADNAEFQLRSLKVGDLDATAAITASTVSTAPQFKGSFNTASFDLKALLKTLGMSVPDTQDGAAMTRVKADMAFSGTPQRVQLPSIKLILDDSTLSGSVAINDLARQALQFDLALDRIDADRYLPPAAKATPSAAQASAEGKPAAASQAQRVTAAPSVPKTGAVAELLPVETLRGLNLDGKFRAGNIIIKKMALQNLALAIHARDGDVQLTDLSGSLLEGTLSGSAGVDVRGAKPRITTRLDLKNLQTEALLAPLTSAPVLSGRSSLSLNTSTQGNDKDALLRDALGQLDLTLADGVLHGVNLNQVVADALKQKLGDFSALMPDYETRLPKALKSDTALRNLLAHMKVENGHLLTPDMSASSEAGQFSAKGDIDLAALAFDYRFGVILASLADHKYLKGTEWPVRCRGTLDTPAKDWCRPDMKAIGGVLQHAAGLAMREKATEKLGEKLGVSGASEVEVKAQVQQKAQEKVNEQVNKQLDKWFKRSKKDAAAPAPAAPPVTP